VSLFAIASLGGRVAPLNPALTLPEFSTRLSALSPYGVIVPRHLVDKLRFAKSVVKNISCWIMDVEGSGTSSSVRIDETGSTPKEVPTSEPHTPSGADEVASLVFTGGTTGAPKLVPWTHRNIDASIKGISSGYALSPNDVTLIVMPIFHGHGLSLVCCRLWRAEAVLIFPTQVRSQPICFGRMSSAGCDLVYRSPDNSPHSC